MSAARQSTEVSSTNVPGPVHKRTYRNIIECVGNTRLVRLNRVIPAGGAEVLLKLEFDNPLASVKDRIGFAMIEAAQNTGKIRPRSADGSEPGTLIIEPTSGNTGIALAFVCAAKGYRLTLTMPESMSLERRALLKHLGAQLVLTPADKGMKGAIAKAQELVEQNPGSYMPQQFDNPSNPAIHEATTGPEIWADTGGKVDCIVSGVGTGGTITGVTRYIRRFNPDFKAIAGEPAASPVISGGQPGLHKIQGMGAGFVPKNLDTSLLSGVELVSNDDAFAWAKRLAKEEGILAGISTGANVCIAARVAARPEFKGKRIVTIACSFGERYLSTALFAEATA
ncbi:MAG: cysteine synthase A [Phycisphaerales bacterium]|nr:cysteine synthase A [Phycisphaerales bacterium]